MFFASDNAGPVPQQVLDQMVSANSGYLPSYGADPQMEQVTRLVGEKFEAPDAAVYLVGTGTAANALALSTLSQPWETVFVHPCRTFTRMSVMRQNFTWVAANLHLLAIAIKLRQRP